MTAIWLRQLTKDDVSSAGGKGASLGEMTKMGLNIPPGFVVTADVYKRFIEESGLTEKIPEIMSKIDVNNPSAVQQHANQIQKLIVDRIMPEDIKEEILDYYHSLDINSGSTEEILKKQVSPFVAVRSSALSEDGATTSFAGLHATFLNVKGDEQLIRAVKSCWASLYTARSITYRKTHNLEEDNAIAVVVQLMIDSNISGVMFTANPVTNSRDEMIIESCFGLGEALVSGSISPDMYTIKKDPLEVLKTEVREKKFKYERDIETNETVKVELGEKRSKTETLAVREVLDTAKEGKKIEKAYGIPMDIEFAWYNDELFILQARPITTLPPLVQEETETPEFITCPDCHNQMLSEAERCPGCGRLNDKPSKPGPDMAIQESLAQAFYKASQVVFACDDAIVRGLKKKYLKIYKQEIDDFDRLVLPLGEDADDLKKVHELATQLREEYRLLSPEEVKFVLETAKKFVNEF